MKNIGKRILELRGKTSRKVFSEELGIGTSTLQRYESGERPPDISFVLKLQEVTGCTLDYLIKGGDTDCPKKNNLTEQEALLLEGFRSLNNEHKQVALQAFLGGVAGFQNSPVINSFNGTILNSFNGK